MTFKELRQHVMKNCVLNTDFFGEEVTIDGPSEKKTCRVLISHSQDNGRRQGVFEERENIDEHERIRVVFSKNASWEYSRQKKPAVGEKLVRDAEKDADQRPFAWRGETEFESDVHAVYIYIRVKRTIGSTV